MPPDGVVIPGWDGSWAVLRYCSSATSCCALRLAGEPHSPVQRPQSRRGNDGAKREDRKLSWPLRPTSRPPPPDNEEHMAYSVWLRVKDEAAKTQDRGRKAMKLPLALQLACLSLLTTNALFAEEPLAISSVLKVPGDYHLQVVTL